MRKARIAGALLFALIFLFAFLGSGALSSLAFGAIGASQVYPSAARLLAQGLGAATMVPAIALAITLAITLLFGRLYCSVLCPLGIAQDAAIRLGKRRGAWKGSYQKNRPALRAAAFAFASLALLSGLAGLAGLLDPYSLSGRFVGYALKPAMLALGTVVSALYRAFGGYWRVSLHGFELIAAIAAALPMLLIAVAAFFKGRLFCSTLCPVGAVLGTINRVAVFKPRLDEGLCTSCGACARVCKAHCIDTRAKALDSGRCVSCFSCIPACPAGAIRYGRASSAPLKKRDARLDGEKRGFLKATLIGGGAFTLAALLPAKAAAALSSAALNSMKSRTLDPAAPPGASSRELFLERCSGCGLCVSKCPSGVLKPSLLRYGAPGLLAPYLDYEHSYCQYECALCLELCPTGALRRMTLEDKKLAQLGSAALVRDKCIVITDKTACGACAEHCPTGAVRMVAGISGLNEPLFDEAICIGCGACHHVCPAEPDKAITVRGKVLQTAALPPTKDLFKAAAESQDAAAMEAEEESADEFPF
jgi:ferredoxin